MELTLGSLFDGIGGFPLAGSYNGITPVWASEIESFPIKVTTKRFPDMVHMGDITKINGAKLPPVDIITGGSPCQDLSIAGKRAGLAGARSGLFMEQVRIVKEMRREDQRNGRTGEFVRPRYFVWENVPGAFSSAGGKDYLAVLEETARIAEGSLFIPGPPSRIWKPAGAVLGCGFSLAWRVLDAQYWGVPQRRKRIFLVADFGGHSAPQILFEQAGVLRDTAKGGGAWQRAAGAAERSAGDSGGDRPVKEKMLCLNDQGGQRMDVTNDVTGTLRAGMCHHQPLVRQQPFVQSYCIAGNIIDRKTQNGGNGLGCQPGISYTLSTADRHAVFCRRRTDGFERGAVASTQCARQYKDATDLVCPMIPVAEEKRQLIRRLTPLECERLQGFPDRWTEIEGASDSARYKALGNSVAIPCVDFVLKGIAFFLRKSKYEQED